MEKQTIWFQVLAAISCDDEAEDKCE